MGFNQNHRERLHPADPHPQGLQDRYPRGMAKDSGELVEECHPLEPQGRDHKVKVNSGQEVGHLSKDLGTHRDHLGSNKGDHSLDTHREDLGIHRLEDSKVDQGIHKQDNLDTLKVKQDSQDILKVKVSLDISLRVPQLVSQDPRDKHHPIQLVASLVRHHTHRLASPMGQLAHRDQHHHIQWVGQGQPHTHKLDILIRPLEHLGHRDRQPLTPWEDSLDQPPTHTMVP